MLGVHCAAVLLREKIHQSLLSVLMDIVAKFLGYFNV